MRLVEGFGVAQIQFSDLQVMFMIEARHFVQYLDIYPFVRLQANGQLVLRQLLPGLFKQIQFRGFEVNHYL